MMRTKLFFLAIAFFNVALLQAQFSFNDDDIYYNNGNVGIGLNSPTSRLHIQDGMIQIAPPEGNNTVLRFLPEENASVNFLPFVNSSNHLFLDLDLSTPTDTTNATVRFFRRTNTSGARKVDFLRGNGTTRVAARISTDEGNSFFNRYGGNVGIGMTNPSARLHVNGNISMRSENNHNYTLSVDNNGDLNFIGDGEVAMEIRDASGNVIIHNGNLGVGITSPSSKLHVDGDIRIQSPNNNTFRMRVTDDGNFRFIRDGSHTAMVISDGTGAVGINMENIPAGYRLAVNGNVRCREVRVTNSGWSDFVFADDC